MTLSFYAEVLLHRDGEAERLKALVGGGLGQPKDSKDANHENKPAVAV